MLAGGGEEIQLTGGEGQRIIRVTCLGPEVGGKKNPGFYYPSWTAAMETVKNAMSQHLYSKACGPNTLEDRLPLFNPQPLFTVS